MAAAKKIGGFTVSLPPDAALTEANFATLQTAAKVTFNAGLRHRLNDAFTRYQEDSALWSAAPSPADVSRVLADIAGHAVALDDALHLLATPRPAQEAARTAIRTLVWRMDSDLGELHRAVGLLRHAASRAAAVSPRPSKSDRGRKGDQARVRLAATLLAIFRAAGGEGTISNKGGCPSGPFFEFLQKAQGLAGVTHVTPDGTRGLIARAVPILGIAGKRDN
jgi:hypothetical protein